MNNLTQLSKKNINDICNILMLDCKASLEIQIEKIEHYEYPFSSMAILTLKSKQKLMVYYFKSANIPKLKQHGLSCGIESEYKILSNLHNYFINISSLSVIEPVVYVNEFNAIVTKKATGLGFNSYLNNVTKINRFFENIKMAEWYIELSGKWLKLFHQHTFVEVKTFELNKTLAICKRKLNFLEKQSSPFFTSNTYDKIEKKCNKLFSCLSDKNTQISLRHADYSPHNIIISDEGISVLDFTTSHNESIYYDFCDFWYSLEFMKYDLFQNKSQIKDLQLKFLETYDKKISINNPLFKIISFQFILIKLVKLTVLLSNKNLRIKEKINYKYIYYRLIISLYYLILR